MSDPVSANTNQRMSLAGIAEPRRAEPASNEGNGGQSFEQVMRGRDLRRQRVEAFTEQNVVTFKKDAFNGSSLPVKDGVGELSDDNPEAIIDSRSELLANFEGEMASLREEEIQLQAQVFNADGVIGGERAFKLGDFAIPINSDLSIIPEDISNFPTANSIRENLMMASQFLESAPDTIRGAPAVNSMNAVSGFGRTRAAQNLAPNLLLSTAAMARVPNGGFGGDVTQVEQETSSRRQGNNKTQKTAFSEVFKQSSQLIQLGVFLKDGGLKVVARIPSSMDVESSKLKREIQSLLAEKGYHNADLEITPIRPTNNEMQE